MIFAIVMVAIFGAIVAACTAPVWLMSPRHRSPKLPPTPNNVICGVELPPADDAGWEFGADGVVWGGRIHVSQIGQVRIDKDRLCEEWHGYDLYSDVKQLIGYRESQRAIAAIKEIRGAGTPYRLTSGGQS